MTPGIGPRCAPQGPEPPRPADAAVRGFLAGLIAAGMQVDSDVVQISETTWAVHGWAGYDGEILLAEFTAAETAYQVLDELPPATGGKT